MRKVFKIVSPALVAAIALGAAAPAMAQPTPYRSDGIRNQIEELAKRVNRSDNRDRISEREARALRSDVRRLQGQYRAFNRDGLQRNEVRTLQQRIDQIKVRLRYERKDRDGRRW